METFSLITSMEFESLVGRTVDAVFQDQDYWHVYVALRCTDGTSIVFTTEDVSIARYFEVFPLKVRIERSEQRAWQELEAAMTFSTVTPLIREEWLEPSGPVPGLVGAPPHYVQHAGRGPAPKEAVQHTAVQAGVELRCCNGESLIVYASSTAPFNVEFAVTQREVEHALSAFNATAA